MPLKVVLTEADIEGLRDYVQWHGAAHAEECPGDDTCDCACKPMNDAVNTICQKAFDAQVGAFPVYQAVEWQCRHVDPDTKLCCVRELNHEGEHRLAEDFRVLASAMRKMLPPKLLQDVIAHLDPLTPFVKFLRETHV